MATQAGWYNAPGEPGMLRYWGGDAWTDHRQPAPAEQPAPVLQPVAVQQPAPVLQQVPVLQPVAVAADDARPDPYAASTPNAWGGESQPFVPEQPRSHFTTGANIGFNIDGIPVGPGALSQLAEFGAARSQIQDAMREARTRAASQPRSTALKGAVSSMIVGLVIVVLGVALVLFFSSQSRVGPGEVATQGTVSDTLGVGSSCHPLVTFTVGSQTYGADQGIGGSCQSDSVGESVDVIYTAANPSVGARYDFGSPFESFDLLVPLFGVVVFVSGVGAFVVRLFRRRSQFAAGPDRP